MRPSCPRSACLRRSGVLLLLVLIAAFGPAQEIRFLTWNLESGGSAPAVIAHQLADLGRYDVLALTEVDDDEIERFEAALDSLGDYALTATSAGGNDRIVIAWNRSTVRLLRSEEIPEISLVSYRPGLWAQFEQVASDERFTVAAVHLARGSDGEEFSRHAQSRALRIWASRRTSSPLVMLGDFNYDWHVETSAQDEGYVLLTAGDLRWIRPVELLPTISGYPSVLDFVFANEAARAWAWMSRIIVRPGDFPDTDGTSDHRPVEARWYVGEQR